MKDHHLFLKWILCTGFALGLVWLVAVGSAPPAIQARPIHNGDARPVGPAFVRPGGTGAWCLQADPCGSLQAAINQSQPGNGDTIYVATGTYTGTGPAVITLTRSITLYGGWDGAANGPIVRDPQLYPTVLDGELARRVISITGDITPTIEGFIIKRGNATGQLAHCPSIAGNPDGCGGGIFVYGAHPIIFNNVIADNVAAVTSQGYPTGTTGYGGGLYLRNADRAIIVGNVIQNNIASKANCGMGGGIALEGMAKGLRIEANDVLNNIAGKAQGWGGGIGGGPNGALIQNNRIEGNQARSLIPSVGYGGGIYQWYGAVTYRNNLVQGNNGTQAVYLGYSASLFEGNRVLNNPASIAIHLNNSVAGTRVILINNVVVHGGTYALSAYGYNQGPLQAALLHNTLVGKGFGAGIFVQGYVTIALTNTLIVSYTWGITATGGTNVVLPDHTLFWANAQNGLTGTNPLFGDPRLQSDGYHLSGGSAARDAGIATEVLTDIDGDKRPIGSGYDIGADETWPTLYLPLVLRKS